ncbi:MAG TPA: polysaccharide biosynthesis tyrosine autokinase, partial [Bacteroidales bacterium]|nr:polysaccharide biosynthesis tyrosine autokinase [Bacteroidales bacterium]
DIKAVVFRILANWYFILAALGISVGIAYFFNHFTEPVYEVSTTLMLKDPERNRTTLIRNQDMFSKQGNIQNTMITLRSYQIVNQAVTELDLFVTYTIEGKYRVRELYPESPFVVVMDTGATQLVNTAFDIRILSRDRYRLEVPGQERMTMYNYQKNQIEGDLSLGGQPAQEYSFGEPVSTKYYSFRIYLTDHFQDGYVGRDFHFFMNTTDQVTGQFSAINIEPVNEEASILRISYKNTNAHKAIDFLNKLTEVYIRNELEEKNQNARRTIEFIDDQLSVISDSMSLVEQELEDFRLSSSVLEPGTETSQLYDQLSDLEGQLAMEGLRREYLSYLERYIAEGGERNDRIIAPSTVGLNDAPLTEVINEYNALIAERSLLARTSTSQNPYLRDLDLKLQNARTVITENIGNLKAMSGIRQRNLSGRAGSMRSELRSLPLAERRLLNIQRNLTVKDQIYTYLLERRAEAAIARASNTPDSKIVDPARYAVKVYPKTSTNYLIAFILGLGLPLAFIFLRDYLNDKIVERRDVEKATDLPVIGHVIHSEGENRIVVSENPKSSVSESFRLVRTNLHYMAQGKGKQVILITSTMVGEGKTFVSMNLASIFALYGKKTLLMGFDLRKPKIFHDLNLSNSKGLSSYLIGRHSLEEVIQSSPLEHLDVILGGPVPPNPAELIASERTGALFQELKEIYDYIIIDSPPVGLVTDAFLLMEHSDVKVFVVRQNFTHRKVFSSIIRDVQGRRIPDLCVLVNDVKVGRRQYGYSYSYGYGYGYGYGQGYGYGYYAEDARPSRPGFWRRFLGKA